MTHVMVVGTEEAQDFQLLDDGVALVGTGFTIDIEWRTAPSSPAPTVAWLSQAVGTVRVTGCEGMALGSYPFRFILTDGAGSEGYAPNGLAADVWKVVRV